MRELTIIPVLLLALTVSAQPSGDSSLSIGLGVTSNPYYQALKHHHIGYTPGIQLRANLPKLPVVAQLQYNFGNLSSSEDGKALSYGFLGIAVTYQFQLIQRNKWDINLGLGPAMIILIDGSDITSDYTAYTSSQPSSGNPLGNNRTLALLRDDEFIAIRADVTYRYAVTEHQNIAVGFDLDFLTVDFFAHGDPRLVSTIGLLYEYRF